MFSFYSQGQDAIVPVRLLSNAGQPVTGVTADTVTVTMVKPDGVAPTGNVAGFTWVEYTFGALAGQGIYAVTLPAVNIDQSGEYIIAISSSAGASAAAEIDVQAASSADVMARLGTPTGASVSADIAAATTLMASSAARLLGLNKENSVLDSIVYNGDGQATSSRLRCYDSKANALVAGSTGLLFQYAIVATYANGTCASYQVTREL